MNKELPIVLERAICQICNNVHEHGGVILGRKFVSEANLKTYEDIMKQATHFAWCKDCEEKILDGYLALIEIDEDKSTEKIPFRTGMLMWMRARVFEDMFNHESFMEANKKKAVYVIEEVFQHIARLVDDGNDPAENGDDLTKQ